MDGKEIGEEGNSCKLSVQRYLAPVERSTSSVINTTNSNNPQTSGTSSLTYGGSKSYNNLFVK
jgi:hypothetical protein